MAYGHVDAVVALLEGGADANYSNEHGGTALMAGAYFPDGRALRALLAAGADIEAKDADGRNALVIACQSGAASTVACLLEHGASANELVGATQTSPLVWAVYNDSHGAEVIGLLLSAGADPNSKDASGRTPKDHASVRNPDFLTLL